MRWKGADVSASQDPSKWRIIPSLGDGGSDPFRKFLGKPRLVECAPFPLWQFAQLFAKRENYGPVRDSSGIGNCLSHKRLASTTPICEPPLVYGVAAPRNR